MNLVYGCAFVTIVAAAGVNAQKRLPGIPGSEKRARSHLYYCEVVEGQKIGIQLPSLREQISNSKWSTRAWTFQEGLFSRRYLVITDEQIYWECSQAAYCEAVEEPFDTFPNMTVLPSLSRVLGSPFSEQRDFKDLYFQLVSDYSKRHMTYQSDALEAFGGVLEQFEINFGMKFVQGIPKNGFDEFLFWNHDTFERSNQSISRR